MTADTIDFLLWVLSQQTINVAAPDARIVAARTFTAMDELAAARAALSA